MFWIFLIYIIFQTASYSDVGNVVSNLVQTSQQSATAGNNDYNALAGFWPKAVNNIANNLLNWRDILEDDEDIETHPEDERFQTRHTRQEEDDQRWRKYGCY